MLGLFSLVALLAHRLMTGCSKEVVRRAAWYDKPHPTLSDALGVVRQESWAQEEPSVGRRGKPTR